jgi:NAD(P)H-dependent flavin oxidoreductase YrpB (nitropropane dioxygenase family)
MSSLLDDLGATMPIIAAPMAGGPTTPALVIAAAAAGAVGFLAAGYKTADAFAEQIAAVRAAGVPFGVNLFAPNPVPVDPAEFRSYAQRLQPEGERYGLDLAQTVLSVPVEDDDHWHEKVAVLLDDPVPIVSFTFGLPPASDVRALRERGMLLVQTVTSAAEAQAATEAGLDALAVQASAAGGHSGTFTPQRIPPPTPLIELLAQVRAVTSLPLLAAGGLTTSQDVAAALHAGAVAVAVGTVLLSGDESGASAPYKRTLADPGDRQTVVTRAFSGRPARGLRNDFIDRYDAVAPLGYPAVNTLTTPLRRAAAAAGDAELINLWAGTGFRHVRAEPVETILTRLAAGV